MQTSKLPLMVLMVPCFAFGGGIERQPQSSLALFQDGNYMEVSYVDARPDVTGKTYSTSQQTGSVAGRYELPSGAIKLDISPRVAAALTIDRPFGIDLAYPAANSSLGGTEAHANTLAITGLLKYKLDHGFSVFGGLRRQSISGSAELTGSAYYPIDKYQVRFDEAWSTGYVYGGAFEIPEIAFRTVLTYNSAMKYDVATTESGTASIVILPFLPKLQVANFDGQSTTSSELPKSWDLDFQTGVSHSTLLFGGVRYVEHREFLLSPKNFTALAGQPLAAFNNSTTYSLGLGQRFNPSFSAFLGFIYEGKGGATESSPLAPYLGYKTAYLGGAYQLSKAVQITGFVAETRLGNAVVAINGTPVAHFENNTLLTIGGKVKYSF